MGTLVSLLIAFIFSGIVVFVIYLLYLHEQEEKSSSTSSTSSKSSAPSTSLTSLVPSKIPGNQNGAVPGSLPLWEYKGTSNNISAIATVACPQTAGGSPNYIVNYKMYNGGWFNGLSFQCSNNSATMSTTTNNGTTYAFPYINPCSSDSPCTAAPNGLRYAYVTYNVSDNDNHVVGVFPSYDKPSISSGEYLLECPANSLISGFQVNTVLGISGSLTGSAFNNQIGLVCVDVS
ncbi:hypothetical protein Gasu2_33730 [Galdieria sulphuraria]|nr:hypothetical protein Gasu2_33730 [Galdieria sulphuraria]